MKKAEIKIGSVYAVKVSNKLSPVKITGVSIYGGWDATNLDTQRAVRVRTAGRLRFEIEKVGEKWKRVENTVGPAICSKRFGNEPHEDESAGS